MDKRVVLAYSGGLDTTVAIPWLKEKGYKVIAFSVDVGQGKKDFDALIKRAHIAGAEKVIVKDLTKEFLSEYAYKALKAGALYEGRYYLATALSRPLIAKYLVEIAKLENCEALAHGCTGKGNDQVRFDVAVKILAPELKIIAPLREWELKSRAEEIKYAKKRSIPLEVKKSEYSIDRNIWGISIECGVLENIEEEVPQDVYLLTNSIDNAPNKAEYVEIEFKKGLPVGLDKKRIASVQLVQRLNAVGAKHGIGRTDMVENRLVGIKSREVYESPAAAILYAAHRELESIILDRETFHFKEILSVKYAELIYFGLWFTPLKEALDKFIDYTQETITGVVKLKLNKGNITIASRKSKFSKYNIKLATYGKGDIFDHKAAEGFIKIWAQPFMR